MKAVVSSIFGVRVPGGPPVIYMDKQELIDIYGEGLTFYDGYDDCIEGVCLQFGRDPVICYNKNKIIDLFIKDGMTYEEAIEYFEYNVLGAYVGETTPAFIETMA